MPKGGKKGVRNKNSGLALDFKLADYADSSTHSGRIRKSVGGTLDKNVKDIDDTEEALWYEKDLEEFNLLQISSDNQKKLQKHRVGSDESTRSPGIRYPIDVWFLIAQFIKPEDVKLFACICKDSHYVSRTYSFWVKMYKRYYQPDITLPSRLQPDCIEQCFCLKPCVVRALYHMYPHFSSQLTSRLTTSDVYCLSNLCCTLMWRVQQDNKWMFHFKFQTSGGTTDTSLSYRVAIKDWWHHQELTNQDMYVNHNPNDGCKLLQFTSSYFVAVPPLVMGSRLSDVRMNLAHDMRRQKLQLTFCYANYRQSSTNMSRGNRGYSDVVEFDAIENLMVLNWWHPQYPYDLKV